MSILNFKKMFLDKKMDKQAKQKIYKKRYYEKNKEKIREYNNTKIMCPICMKKISRSVIRRHERSKTHQKMLEIIKDNVAKLQNKAHESPL